MLVRLSSREQENGKLGNKGKFLLLMKQNGFNVPDGFVLDSDTYDETVRGKAEEIISQALENLNKDNIKETSNGLNELFNKIKLPEKTADEIKSIVSSDKLYAVRSSGTKEDLDEFSFAGQYQTFLNTKPEDVEARVIDCYKSMFSEIILSYLVNRKIDTSELKMSVVVQEMVASDKSGICFTIDPVTGNDKTMLIEVSEGLGEDIVSGKTVPEQYHYNWYDNKETDRAEGSNEVGNLVHSMVGEHAAHRESAKIDAVAVNLMLGHHLVDDCLDEVDVAITGSVPRFVDSIGEYNDKLGCITHFFHAHLVVLELAVLHPVGILIVAVTKDEQRAILAEILGCIDIVRTAGAIDGDVVGFHRQRSCHKHDKRKKNLFHKKTLLFSTAKLRYSVDITKNNAFLFAISSLNRNFALSLRQHV